MNGDHTSKWEVFRVPVHGRQRIALRFSWQVARKNADEVALVLQRMVSPEHTAVLGAFLVNGAEGVRLPHLKAVGYLIPPEALQGTAFYLLFEEERAKDGAIRTVAEWIPLDDELQVENYRSTVALADAWPKPAPDREEEVATLRRLAGTGGTSPERKAYRRSALRCLATTEHPRSLDIQERLTDVSALDGLEKDMQPLVSAVDVFRIAGQASEGDLEAVTKGIGDLPRPLQVNPDVRVLLDLARENRTNPGALMRGRLRKMKEALGSERYQECVEYAHELGAEQPLDEEVQQIYAQAVVRQLDAFLRAGDAPGVEEILEREQTILENALGSEHPWLASVRGWVEGQGAAFETEGVPFAEILPDEEGYSLTLWGKMRTWLGE